VAVRRVQEGGSHRDFDNFQGLHSLWNLIGVS
jgi:hypothetical protein